MISLAGCAWQLQSRLGLDADALRRPGPLHRLSWHDSLPRLGGPASTSGRVVHFEPVGIVRTGSGVLPESARCEHL
jgi:hypothetical protein